LKRIEIGDCKWQTEGSSVTTAACKLVQGKIINGNRNFR